MCQSIKIPTVLENLLARDFSLPTPHGDNSENHHTSVLLHQALKKMDVSNRNEINTYIASLTKELQDLHEILDKQSVLLQHIEAAQHALEHLTAGIENKKPVQVLTDLSWNLKRQLEILKLRLEGKYGDNEPEPLSNPPVPELPDEIWLNILNKSALENNAHHIRQVSKFFKRLVDDPHFAKAREKNRDKFGPSSIHFPHIYERWQHSETMPDQKKIFKDCEKDEYVKIISDSNGDNEKNSQWIPFEEREKALFRAVKSQDLEALKRLEPKVMDIFNLWDINGFTLAHWALMKNNVEIQTYLINCVLTDKKSTPRSRLTILLVCNQVDTISFDNENLKIELLWKNEPITFTARNFDALKDTFYLLIHSVARYNHISLLNKLLAQDIFVKIDDNKISLIFQNFLNYAFQFQSSELLKFWFESNLISKEKKEKILAECVKLYLTSKPIFPQIGKNYDGNSAAFVETLIECLSDTERKSLDIQKLLFNYTYNLAVQGKTETLTKVLDNLTDSLCIDPSSLQLYIMDGAAAHGHLDCLKELITFRLKLSSKNIIFNHEHHTINSFNSCIVTAIQNRQTQCAIFLLEELLRLRPEKNIKDIWETPHRNYITSTIEYQDFGFMKYLVEKGLYMPKGITHIKEMSKTNYRNNLLLCLVHCDPTDSSLNGSWEVWIKNLKHMASQPSYQSLLQEENFARIILQRYLTYIEARKEDFSKSIAPQFIKQKFDAFWKLNGACSKQDKSAAAKALLKLLESKVTLDINDIRNLPEAQQKAALSGDLGFILETCFGIEKLNTMAVITDIVKQSFVKK